MAFGALSDSTRTLTRFITYSLNAWPPQVAFGALSDSTRAALATGLDSTEVEKQIENEGDDALYALLPEVQTPASYLHTCAATRARASRALGELPHQRDLPGVGSQLVRGQARPTRGRVRAGCAGTRARASHALGELPHQRALTGWW